MSDKTDDCFGFVRVAGRIDMDDGTWFKGVSIELDAAPKWPLSAAWGGRVRISLVPDALSKASPTQPEGEG